MPQKVITHIDENGNATVLLNRPEVHNAFDPEMVEQLDGALKKIGENEKVRSIVLVGAGESFCAGADIAHMKKSATYSPRKNEELALQTSRMLRTLYELEKPTIACIRGAVRGGGCGLVAACDIAIAARTATFRLSEVKLGIIPSMISPYVVDAMGARMAHRYMISGEEFDSAEAYRIGFVHDIVEDEELNGRVGMMLAQIYSSGPKAIVAVKALIPAVANRPIDDALIAETSKRIAAIRATPEAQEGLSAFLEKRAPKWTAPARPKKTGAAAPKQKKRAKRQEP